MGRIRGSTGPRNTAPKRVEPIEKAGDIAFLLALRLRELPVAIVHQRYNDMRRQRAYYAAKEQGFSDADAERAAATATVSLQTVYRDLRQVERSLVKANAVAGKALVRRRLKELEIDRRKLLLAEARAWEELDRSGREALALNTTRTDVAVQEAIVTVRREEIRSADPRWMDQITSIIWKRFQLDCERFRLMAMLGLETPKELRAVARAGSAETIAGLRAHEVGLLYSLDATNAGIKPGEVRQRLEMVTAFLEEGAAGARGSRTESVIFEVRGLEIDE